MRVCGVEIKGSEAIICLMTLKDGLFELPDCRQTRFALSKDQEQQQMRHFQFTFAKFIEDSGCPSWVSRMFVQKHQSITANLSFNDHSSSSSST